MPPDTNKELTDAIVNKAMAKVRDRQSRPTEQVDAVKDEEATRCHWRSRDLGMCIKVWDTGCGDVRERLSQENCPTCGKRIWLTGFDAWWEARKSYHP